MKNLIYFLCALFLMHGASFARPVSYPGGWTLMQQNNADFNSLHVHYSPSAKYSVGYKAEYWRDNEWQFHGLQLNYLAKRVNRPKSQANFYIKSGAGFAYSDFDNLESKTEPAAFAGLAMDWEDRRFFTSYENRFYYAGDIDKFASHSARVGVAPYIGSYGDLHTWIMLQADYNPKKSDSFSVSPILRFFKGEYLTEIGVSDDGDATLNFVIRF